MTKILDLDSRPDLDEVLQLVEQGDDVVLMRNGRVLAEVKPGEENKPKKRTLGLSAGAVTYMADDFDAELPDSFWLGEE